MATVTKILILMTLLRVLTDLHTVLKGQDHWPIVIFAGHAMGFGSVQSLGWLGCRGDTKDNSAKMLHHSFLREAVLSSSGIRRDLHVVLTYSNICPVGCFFLPTTTFAVQGYWPWVALVWDVSTYSNVCCEGWYRNVSFVRYADLQSHLLYRM